MNLLDPATSKAFIEQYKRLLSEIAGKRLDGTGAYVEARRALYENNLNKTHPMDSDYDTSFVEAVRNAQYGLFIYAKKYRQGYALKSEENVWYFAQALTTPLEEMVPDWIVIVTAILPYPGQYICDGFVVDKNVAIGKNMIHDMIQELKTEREKHSSRKGTSTPAQAARTSLALAMGIDTRVNKRIATELDRLAQDEKVCIVYACESGSRAWGFESSDSDYDVRFIYLHPARWYLSVAPGRDVIERPISDQLDISGWDLRKALQLLRKSNPPLLEWLKSPIVYREVAPVVSRLRGLVPDYYSPAACHYHYLHMAEGNYREYLCGKDVWIKKYFYVLRPVLACLWIERGYGTPPMEFAVLVERVVENPVVLKAIRDLLRCKKAGAELDRGPRIPAISDFLDVEITRLSAQKAPPSQPTTVAPLDHVFRSSIVDVYGESIQQDHERQQAVQVMVSHYKQTS